MRLSVVVPTLDEEQALPALLDALLPRLAPGEEELLVVDGGSRDGTLAAARVAGLAPGALLTSGEAGRAAQMNLGAAAARGEWLWFVHADTQVEPQALGALRAAVAASGAGWGWFPVRLDARGLTWRVLERAITLRARTFSTPSGDQGLFVRRDLFWRLGGFPPLPLCEDLALVDRLRAAAGPGIELAAPLGTSARRWQRAGVARTVLRMWSIRAAYRLGADPARLARHYRPVR